MYIAVQQQLILYLGKESHLLLAGTSCLSTRAL